MRIWLTFRKNGLNKQHINIGEGGIMVDNCISTIKPYTREILKAHLCSCGVDYNKSDGHLLVSITFVPIKNYLMI